MVSVIVTLLLYQAAVASSFSIHWHANSLVVIGDTSSESHEAKLRAVVSRLFADASKQLQLNAGNDLPPGWSLATEQALRAVALTRSGSAEIDAQRVLMGGYYVDGPAWKKAMTRLSAALPVGMRLKDEAVAESAGRSFAEYCRQQFDMALRGRRVGFRLNSSELRSSAYPLLDAIVEIATDCPDARIIITGHTDASGSAAGNRLLSRQRAEAVRAYIAARGINGARLSAIGAGASRLLDSNDSRAARARNRRIEFEFLLDE